MFSVVTSYLGCAVLPLPDELPPLELPPLEELPDELLLPLLDDPLELPPEDDDPEPDESLPLIARAPLPDEFVLCVGVDAVPVSSLDPDGRTRV